MAQVNFTNELKVSPSNLSDMTVSCKECGKEFKVSADEQAWYLNRGYNVPARCPDCRKVRRKERRAEKKRHIAEKKAAAAAAVNPNGSGVILR